MDSCRRCRCRAGCGPPARFDFRSLSPLFDDDPVILHAKESGDGLMLWTARENGPVAITAEAGWA